VDGENRIADRYIPVDHSRVVTVDSEVFGLDTPTLTEAKIHEYSGHLGPIIEIQVILQANLIADSSPRPIDAKFGAGAWLIEAEVEIERRVELGMERFRLDRHGGQHRKAGPQHTRLFESHDVPF
jgi:hypothetical protein